MKYLLCLALLTSLGCATIFQPGPNTVHLDSNPRGAIVSMDGKAIGETPIDVPISHSDDAVFKFEKEGYETATIEAHKTLSGTYLLNFITPGGIVVGWWVDLLTHSQGHYSEAPIYAPLAKKVANKQ